MREITNAKFALTNEEFREACDNVKLEPTARQASKWRLKKGKAWKDGRTKDSSNR